MTLLEKVQGSRANVYIKLRNSGMDHDEAEEVASNHFRMQCDDLAAAGMDPFLASLPDA